VVAYDIFVCAVICHNYINNTKHSKQFPTNDRSPTVTSRNRGTTSPTDSTGQHECRVIKNHCAHISYNCHLLSSHAKFYS